MESLVDAADYDELSARLDSHLQFGTAGIRGEVGAGPNRMNRAVVIRTTRGLADYLLDTSERSERPVVIGFDARPTSRGFAEDAAGVLAAAGLKVRFFADYAPTPLVAFAVKHLHAAAGVVVTASHNPPADNGYKVYADNGAQIIPPTDVAIAEAIESAPPAMEVPLLSMAFDESSPLVSSLSTEIEEAYWQEVDAARPAPHPSQISIVYTPIHGVGGDLIHDVFKRAGFTQVRSVPEQGEPDGTFPTVSFPNPEEPGALDLALRQAADSSADLVIANDPDADRLAAVVRHQGEWRTLTGNELGVLLGDYVLRHWNLDQVPIVINSIVSSPMLEKIAAVREAHHEQTLTGFKWIANAGIALEEQGVGIFAFGYEEALGFTVGRVVRDKDGISAALVFADLVSGLRDSGMTPVDRLIEMWEQVGVWASAQHSITRLNSTGPQEIATAVERLADEPPSSVAGIEVTDFTDYRTGAESRPSWLGAQSLLEMSLGEQGRVLVRPSGTEPKLKIYADLSAEAGPDPLSSQAELTERAREVATNLAGTLSF